MAEHALQWRPDFFINTGDLVGNGHDYDQWPEHFSRFAAMIAQSMMVTARGNHEGSRQRDIENDWFAKYHELPGQGEPFAAFDWGNVHVVLLSHEYLREAAEWLDDHLDTIPDHRYVIVVHHYPIYCTGYESPVDKRKEPGKNWAALARVLERHGVELDICGHTHIYERIYPLLEDRREVDRGVHYLVQGGDINANYPEPWTAVGDDPATTSRPTYSVVRCLEDRIEVRSFCWSTVEKAIVQMDRFFVVRDPAIPEALLTQLLNLDGAPRIQTIEDLGAMLHAPAAPALATYLTHGDPATVRAASAALALIGARDVAKPVFDALAHPDVAVQRNAARALESDMPAKFAKRVAKAVLDPERDEIVRIRLMGALEFHAPPKRTVKTALVLLGRDGPRDVRRRAAYALKRVVKKGHVRKLAKRFERESDPYVVLRIAFTLNDLTGVRQNLGDQGAVATSRPGQRAAITDKWRAGRP